MSETPKNTPQKPVDPVPDASPTDHEDIHNPSGTTPNGIPDGLSEHDAKGLPTDDRHQTETAADD